MLKKKVIKREISLMHFLLLATSKILIGIGLGIVIATKFWFAQPLWYIILLIGALILIPTLYYLTKAEVKEELKLKKKLRKR